MADAGCRVVVLISADAEWKALLAALEGLQGEPEASPLPINRSLLGEWGEYPVAGEEIVFFHGGWGKIAAAASTQFAIDFWKPDLLINLGTCGGFPGSVELGTIVLAERTLVYDIVEQMGDFDQAITAYTTTPDLSWIKGSLPENVRAGVLASADRDLISEEIQRLKDNYGAIAADWESGAIAWVATRNRLPCLILRGVTDLVKAGGSDVYGNYDLFAERTAVIMNRLVKGLPFWKTAFDHARH